MNERTLLKQPTDAGMIHIRVKAMLMLGIIPLLPYIIVLAQSDDPFAGLETPPLSEDSSSSRFTNQPGFLGENFTYRNELFSQISYGPRSSPNDEQEHWYSRQSIGFEIQKKFSSTTSTLGSFDFQGRLVRRDHFIPVINDEEGDGREGWFPEYHNAYLDLYNILNPLLSNERRNTALGHFNFRFGRFYLPFGLNLQTDTHGTVLQLSNDRNFGFARDWYAGFWGSITPKLNYDIYYLLGSGYDPSFGGQDGMLGSRISLSNYFLNEYGVAGGISILIGERRSRHSLDINQEVTADSNRGRLQTRRYGADVRYIWLIPTGSLTGTTELSLGKDSSENVFTQLYQVDYLHRSRTWGLSSQYRYFYQDREMLAEGDVDSSIIAEATWFFKNDIGNSNLHWIKINVERQLERMESRNGTVTTLQYYRYW